MSAQDVPHHIRALFTLITNGNTQQDRELASRIKAVVDQFSSKYSLQVIRGIIQGAVAEGDNNSNSPIRLAIMKEMPLTWEVLYNAGGRSLQFQPPFNYGDCHKLDAIVALMSKHHAAFAAVQYSLLTPLPSPTLGPTPMPSLEIGDSMPGSLASSPKKRPHASSMEPEFGEGLADTSSPTYATPKTGVIFEEIGPPADADTSPGFFLQFRRHTLGAEALASEGCDTALDAWRSFHAMSACSEEDDADYKRARAGDRDAAGTPSAYRSPPTPSSENGTMYRHTPQPQGFALDFRAT